MKTRVYPNRDAIRDANDIYLDAMRAFINHNLKQITGEKVEDLIAESLNDDQLEMFDQMFDEHKNVVSAIDFNYIPQIITKNWELTFGAKFGWDLVVKNMLWLIRDGRNNSEHKGSEDVDHELARTQLFLISRVLKKVNRSDLQVQVDKIRDDLSTDVAKIKISELTEQLEKEKNEKKQYKKHHQEVEENLNVLQNQHEEVSKELTTTKVKLTEVEKNQGKIEEELTDKSKELKEYTDMWSECDKDLTITRKHLHKEKETRYNLEEELSTLKKQFKDNEKEIKDLKKQLASTRNELKKENIEKKETEDSLSDLCNLFTATTIANPTVNNCYPDVDTVSSVRLLDRRNTEKKNYLLKLLELKQPSLIYVFNQAKINQFMNLVGEENVNLIGTQNEHTSKSEVKNMLKKLENGELIAIVTDTIFTNLTVDHCIGHFAFCHPVVGLDDFYQRCQPAFSSAKPAFLHLIYDKTEDFQEIINEHGKKYLNRETLIKLYKGLQDSAESEDILVNLDKVNDELNLPIEGFETGITIFEELRFIERNEKKIRLLPDVEKKELYESETYSIGEKLKQGIKEFQTFQSDNTLEQIWNKIQEFVDK